MKKIVINTRFGGFRLSNAGLIDYMRRKGKSVYFYEQNVRDGKTEYDRVDLSSVNDINSLFLLPITTDFGEKILDPSIITDDDYASDCEIERDDPDLVATVEELKDVANGTFAQLRVMEIPDDVDWEIIDYDGREHIEEKHRRWYFNYAR